MPFSSSHIMRLYRSGSKNRHARGTSRALNDFLDRRNQRSSEPRTSPAEPQAVQKVRPARPQRVKDRGVPSGYVEGLNDPRTKLADFFNSLLGRAVDPPLNGSL